ncbi:MAG: Hsp20/alpha crystallin family protein [Vicinamibacterales bacterium]
MTARATGSMELNPAELADDVHRLLDDLSKRRPDRRHMVAGECMPGVDVFETEKSVEIVLDLPGVSADCIRVLFKAGVVLVVGEKERPDFSKRAPASFHLVERDFGRFARAVRVNAAIDGANVRARLHHGELRIVLPRITERRGAGLLVPIDAAKPASESPPHDAESASRGPR